MCLGAQLAAGRSPGAGAPLRRRLRHLGSAEVRRAPGFGQALTRTGLHKSRACTAVHARCTENYTADVNQELVRRVAMAHGDDDGLQACPGKPWGASESG